MENRNNRNADAITSPRSKSPHCKSVAPKVAMLHRHNNIPVVKAAVYTKKYSEEGLEQCRAKRTFCAGKAFNIVFRSSILLAFGKTSNDNPCKNGEEPEAGKIP